MTETSFGYVVDLCTTSICGGDLDCYFGRSDESDHTWCHFTARSGQLPTAPADVFGGMFCARVTQLRATC